MLSTSLLASPPAFQGLEMGPALASERGAASGGFGLGVEEVEVGV